MATYGRQELSPVIGYPLRVSVDGNPIWKAVGVTIDWDTVTPVPGGDVTLNNGLVVPGGALALRYGQVLTRITATGKYGPYDSGASDGRQTLVRGECYVLNETVVELGPIPGITSSPASDHPGVIEGGLVWLSRLIIDSAGQDLGGPAGPTRSDFDAAFPAIQYHEDA